MDLTGSIEPVSLHDLNAFERKLVHRHFDSRSDYSTRTYKDGEKFELRIYPIGNLKKFAGDKAQLAVTTGEKVALPHMNNYERFVIHDHLKSMGDVKAESFGEGSDRHIEIEADIFGRGLKKIIKKIRFF